MSATHDDMLFAGYSISATAADLMLPFLSIPDGPLAEQDMQRRKTLRSLPSRKPYFDRNDVSRIVNFVEPRSWIWLLVSRDSAPTNHPLGM